MNIDYSADRLYVASTAHNMAAERQTRTKSCAFITDRPHYTRKRYVSLASMTTTYAEKNAPEHKILDNNMLIARSERVKTLQRTMVPIIATASAK